MKNSYVSDLLKLPIGESTNVPKVNLLGWVGAKRDQGKIIFLDIHDSTGKIQAVVDIKKIGEEQFSLVKQLPVESGISVTGELFASSRLGYEIIVSNLKVIGGVTKNFSPHPREAINIFDDSLIPFLLDNRHMFIRNPKVMTILRFRDCLMRHIRQWFYDNRFVSIDAPILTPVPLYEDGTAMPIIINGDKVFLTQCVGYYLEAAVHAFERVYNIGPSFRGEESRSKRHLMEYWHIKAEIAWSDLEDIISIVESIIGYITKKCQSDMADFLPTLGTQFCMDGLNFPFPRIGYEEAVSVLRKKGLDIEFGKSLGSHEEEELSKLFPHSPFWITGIPRSIEPFPYVIDQNDTRITRVADLIASNGYGELLGTAEKISDLQMLEERMKDKGKGGDPRFEFVRDVHHVGCVPHSAFGMGVERMIRWMLNIPHVRDAIPFPRTFKRKISP